MSRLFLSHASANNPAALALSAWLTANGWNDHFLDVGPRRGIDPGERWMKALADAVDRCEVVLFLVSPAWRASKYCFAEFYQAKNLGKRIFGLIVEPMALSDLPEQMTAEWQVCDLVAADEPQIFVVDRPPLVPPTEVGFAKHSLDALARGLRKAGLAASTFEWPPGNEPERSPYPGLRALDAMDAGVFFGRDAAVVRAIDSIRVLRERGTERLLAILGPSGAGKSSFLRAGLLPRLRRDPEHFCVLPPIRPERAAVSGTHGLVAALQAAMHKERVSTSQSAIQARLAADGLHAVLDTLSQAHSRGREDPLAAPPTLIVPIDQAEELFSTDGGAEAEELLCRLGELRQRLASNDTTGSALRVLFVLTIRSDALQRLQACATLQALSPVLFSLPPMPASEFKDVIEGPARRRTESDRGPPLTIEPGLTEALIADARGADALPLLALTLEWLLRSFDTPQGVRLGLDAYDGIGRVRGVIGKAVAQALSDPAQAPAIPSHPSEQQALLERVFPLLATVDPDTGQWKRRVASRLALRNVEPQSDALVERLVTQRLLTSDAREMDDGAGTTEVVEVAHEALMRQWDALERWLRTYADDLAATEMIRRAARDWQRGGHDESLLVHSAGRLDSAEALLGDVRLRERFEPTDADYLAACRGRDRRLANEREAQLRRVAEQQAARARWQRLATRGLTAAAVVVAALVLWVVRQTQDVSRQTSLVLASASEAASNEQRFDQALRLALRATLATWLRPAHVTAAPALSRAAASNRLLVIVPGQFAGFSPDGLRLITALKDNTVRVWDAATGRPLGEPMKHDGEVLSASFSADGWRLVTDSEDGTTRVWDAASGKPLGEPMKHDGEVLSASLSPDGSRVVTGSDDDTARVWDAATGKPLGEPMKHGRAVLSASFSPDGLRVVTASHDRNARVWDAATGKLLGEPMKHDGSVESASFSSDVSRLVTASWDNTARVWDAATGKPLGDPMKHDDWVRFASFSPDGSRVVTASQDKTSRVWSAATGKPLGDPMKHDDWVRFASFSPDGSRVVTASVDKTTRVWDAATHNALGDPMKHDGPVQSASFSPDGSRVVTATSDNTAHVWDADTGKARGEPMKHDGKVQSASFSPDGSRVVTASVDKTARVWDAAKGRPLGEPMKHGDALYSASFNPDGSRVVTASADKTARVWDAATGKALGEPMKHDHSVLSASFSPDGSRVVTASVDKTARVWDAATGKALGDPMKHEHGDAVYSASFSLDGSHVLTVSGDYARVWDAATGKALSEPMKDDGAVFSASFSPDGSRVVTASVNGTARIWDPASSKALGEPMKHNDLVSSIRFSPDGSRVVTASWDKTARVWSAATGKPVGEPMKHSRAVLSASFSPDGSRVVTASEDGTARIWPLHFERFTRASELVAEVCSRTNSSIRQIRVQDVQRVPLLPVASVGKDPCEGVAPR